MSPKNRFSKKIPELQYNASGALGWLFESQNTFCDRSGVIGYHEDEFFENSDKIFFSNFRTPKYAYFKLFWPYEENFFFNFVDFDF